MDAEEVAPDAEANREVAATNKPVEVTADDLADEEWGPVKDKGKKSKKGKGKKGNAQDEIDNEEKPGTCVSQNFVSTFVDEIRYFSCRTCDTS